MEDEGVVSGVSWLGDEGVSRVRRVGERVRLGIAGLVRETVRVEGRWMGEGVGLGIAGLVRETVRVEGRWMGSVVHSLGDDREWLSELLRRYMLVVLGEFVDPSQRTFLGLSWTSGLSNQRSPESAKSSTTIV